MAFGSGEMVKSHSIDDQEEVRDVVASFASVFESGYPYDAPLSARLSERAVLAPVLDHFSPDQFEAIRSAAAAVNDSAFYFAIAGTYPDRADDHWPRSELSDLRVISFDDYETYSKTSGFTTNALWSPEGHWGVLVSHEWFAVLGGPHAFMSRLLSSYPPAPREGHGAVPAERQADLLIEDVKTWEDHSWLRDLLLHVYGLEEAGRLLKEHGLGSIAP